MREHQDELWPAGLLLALPSALAELQEQMHAIYV